MNILAFDTSTGSLQIALESDNNLSVFYMEKGLKHAELLMKKTDEMLRQENIKPQDIDLIICGIGPGSFTGLRIGLSSAKGLADSLDIPLKTVSVLDVYGNCFRFWPGSVIPVIDARKERFYGSVYMNGKRIYKYFDLNIKNILSLNIIFYPVLFTGPDCQFFQDVSSDNINIDSYGKRAVIRELLLLGRQKYETEGGDSKDISPLYIRKSDAELANEK